MLRGSYENIQLLRIVIHTKCLREKQVNSVKFHQYDLRLAKIHSKALITKRQERYALVSLGPFQLLVIQSGSLSGTELMYLLPHGMVFKLFCLLKDKKK